MPHQRPDDTDFQDMLFPVKAALLAPAHLLELKREIDAKTQMRSCTPADIAELLTRHYDMDSDMQAAEVRCRADAMAVRGLVREIDGRIVQHLQASDRLHASLRADAHFNYAVASAMRQTKGYDYELSERGTHMFDDPNNKYTNIQSGNVSMGIPLF